MSEQLRIYSEAELLEMQNEVLGDLFHQIMELKEKGESNSDLDRMFDAISRILINNMKYPSERAEMGAALAHNSHP